MKINYILILLTLFVGYTRAQEFRDGAPEMYIYLQNGAPFTTYNFNLKRISLAYETPTTICTTCDAGDETDGVTTLTTGTMLSGQNGYGFALTGGSTAEPYYGYGVYLLRSRLTNNYFYIDFRDDRYGREDLVEINGYHDDFAVLFDVGNNEFLWDPTKDNIFSSIVNKSVVTIWNGNGFSEPRVEDFPTNYWENSLGLFNFTSTDDNFFIGESPMILWGKEKDAENVTDYKLYRAFSPDRSVPSASDYFLINEGSTNLLYYKDNGIKYVGELPQEDDGAAYYYVKSYSGGTYKNTTLVRNARYVKMNWENALLLDNYNNHPRLIWGPYPDGTVSGYKVYKTKSGTTQIAATVSAGTFNWIDYSEFIWTGTYRPVYVSYYVEPIISNPIATNTVTTKVNPWQSKETPPDENGSKSGFNYSLSDNYPNPSTTELYLIPSVDALSLSKC